MRELDYLSNYLVILTQKNLCNERISFIYDVNSFSFCFFFYSLCNLSLHYRYVYACVRERACTPALISLIFAFFIVDIQPTIKLQDMNI